MRRGQARNAAPEAHQPALSYEQNAIVSNAGAEAVFSRRAADTRAAERQQDVIVKVDKRVVTFAQRMVLRSTAIVMLENEHIFGIRFAPETRRKGSLCCYGLLLGSASLPDTKLKMQQKSPAAFGAAGLVIFKG